MSLCETEGCGRECNFRGFGRELCWKCYSIWLVQWKPPIDPLKEPIQQKRIENDVPTFNQMSLF